jgi:hypothetical protein
MTVHPKGAAGWGNSSTSSSSRTDLSVVLTIVNGSDADELNATFDGGPVESDLLLPPIPHPATAADTRVSGYEIK